MTSPATMERSALRCIGASADPCPADSPCPAAGPSNGAVGDIKAERNRASRAALAGQPECRAGADCGRGYP